MLGVVARLLILVVLLTITAKTVSTNFRLDFVDFLAGYIFRFPIYFYNGYITQLILSIFPSLLYQIS